MRKTSSPNIKDFKFSCFFEMSAFGAELMTVSINTCFHEKTYLHGYFCLTGSY